MITQTQAYDPTQQQLESRQAALEYSQEALEGLGGGADKG